MRKRRERGEGVREGKRDRREIKYVGARGKGRRGVRGGGRVVRKRGDAGARSEGRRERERGGGEGAGIVQNSTKKKETQHGYQLKHRRYINTLSARYVTKSFIYRCTITL